MTPAVVYDLVNVYANVRAHTHVTRVRVHVLSPKVSWHTVCVLDQKWRTFVFS